MHIEYTKWSKVTLVTGAIGRPNFRAFLYTTIISGMNTYYMSEHLYFGTFYWVISYAVR